TSFVSFFFSSRRRHTRFSRDWSSDVCSSDLADHEAGHARVGDRQDAFVFDRHKERNNGATGAHHVAVTHDRKLGLMPASIGVTEIGRASCRERVEIWVGAVYSKKDK